MDRRTIILIGILVILGGATFFLANSWLNSQRQGYQRQAAAATKKKQIQTAEILVAKTNLPAGSRIKRENVEWRSWPKKGVVKTHFVKGDKNIEDVLGMIVRQGIYAGEPIVTDRVVEQGSRGYMAALLEPGMRAVSIRVNPLTSVSGFIKPGDRVDIMLTIKGKSLGSLNGRQVTETILRNILVIAVNSVTNDLETKPSAGKTITFQVTPKQAQIFTVGQTIGKMSLVLRSLTDDLYAANTDTDSDTNSKTAKKRKSAKGKGGKSGRKGAAGSSKKKKGAKGKNTKKASDVRKVDNEKSDEDEKVGPIESLRTWDSEVSQVIVQMGGRRKKISKVEVVRGNRSQLEILLDLINKSKDEGAEGQNNANDMAQESKNLLKKSAGGFQAATRAIGSAASVP